MKTLLLVTVMAIAGSAAAEQPELSTREALAAASPAHMRVLESMEAQRGKKYQDDELKSMLQTKEFGDHAMQMLEAEKTE